MTEFSWKKITIASTEVLIAKAEVIRGLPFLPLSLLLQWKEISERPKDTSDAEIIRKYLAGG